jgi:hypothetical protein
MLQQLLCEQNSWSCVCGYLTVKNQPGNPYPEVVPVPMGRGVLSLIIGASITFDRQKWKNEPNRPQITIKSL